jgi:hypothetical protein
VRLGLEANRKGDVHNAYAASKKNFLSSFDSTAKQVFVWPQTRGGSKLRGKIHWC